MADPLRFTFVVDQLPPTVPFVGPETQERRRGRPFAARLGANESPFGPSPLAIEAMRAAAADVWMYGDPDNTDLKVAIAAEIGVAPENIVVGEGIDSLFGFTVRLFVSPGHVVVTSLGAYPTFNFHVAGYGGRLVTVPYLGDREDPAALAETALRDDAKLMFFANPDSPMGSWWGAADVSRLMDNVPARTVLVLDEAYCHFAPEGTVAPLTPIRRNVIRFRTFSKAYGMAGARVAYAVADAEVAAAFDKIRNHFSVNRIAQAGAIAALRDRAHLASVQRQVSAAKARMAEIAVHNGLKPLPSATNFVTMDCGRDGAFARSVLEALGALDVFVRMPGPSPLNRCIRISAGTEQDLDLLARALPQALAAARGP